jgi:hypothetical protein
MDAGTRPHETAGTDLHARPRIAIEATMQQELDGPSPAEADRDSREWYVDFESQD